ncbi:MAG: hypothetical protein IBX68_04280, partial [Dehalococcoidia bacterium]|nr:hypothetical protein [Dehalococcoidia bacterium]
LAGRRFSQPKSSVLLHPLGVAFLLLVGLYASFRYFRRAGVKWKGRVYEQEQPVK